MTEAEDLALHPVGVEDEERFLAMAEHYMCDLDPSFRPREVWRRRFLRAVLEDPDRSALWFDVGGAHAGFAVIRLRDHHYDPARRIGVIAEFYVAPDYRRLGLGRVASAAVCTHLASLGAGEIEVEVVAGNRVAEQFWAAQGFRGAVTRLTRRAEG